MISYIGLGSNLGDRLQHLKDVLVLLKENHKIAIRKISPVYESEPLAGGDEQGDYLNAVLELGTDLEPRELLLVLKEIEERLGRKKDKTRWSSREIDLDLLACDDIVVREPDCEIPHPRLHKRAFVLRPLADVSPTWQHPVSNKKVSVLLDGLTAKGRCRKIEETISLD
ncbi:MAG: 2-amino-4-hydroxy-6-hydroxymethyldihydropteridine diphosphokinase [Candidatus Omnitrophota bacterium]